MLFSRPFTFPSFRHVPHVKAELDLRLGQVRVQHHDRSCNIKTWQWLNGLGYHPWPTEEWSYLVGNHLLVSIILSHTHINITVIQHEMGRVLCYAVAANGNSHWLRLTEKMGPWPKIQCHALSKTSPHKPKSATGVCPFLPGHSKVTQSNVVTSSGTSPVLIFTLQWSNMAGWKMDHWNRWFSYSQRPPFTSGIFQLAMFYETRG